MTIILKDNETGNLLENKVVEDEEKITAFNQMCSELKNSSDEKYSEAFFDSITSSEYTSVSYTHLPMIICSGETCRP